MLSCIRDAKRLKSWNINSSSSSLEEHKAGVMTSGCLTYDLCCFSCFGGTIFHTFDFLLKFFILQALWS